MAAVACRDIIFAFTAILLLASHAAACGVVGAGGVNFTYSGAAGPERWGCLSPNYGACAEGKHQSPINIVKKDAVWNGELKSLRTNYIPTNATLVDNFYNIMLQYNQTVGAVHVNGTKYHLQQMHWHSPSEHTIDGVRFPMELHLVHRSDYGNITVVAVLYKYGDPDKFLFEIKDKVAMLAKDVCLGKNVTRVPVGIIDTKALPVKHKTLKYYRYVGSLSTPPCTENVIWNVLAKVREMTKEQAAALVAPLSEEYKHNSRPLQPLNGRIVEVYDEKRNSVSC